MCEPLAGNIIRISTELQFYIGLNIYLFTRAFFQSLGLPG